MSLFKDLVGKEITEETAVQLETMLSEHIQSALSQLQTQFSEKETELTKLTEQIEHFESYSKEQYEQVVAEKTALSESLEKQVTEQVGDIQEKYTQAVAQLAELKESHEAEVKQLREGVEQYAEYLKEELNKEAEKKLTETVELFKTEHQAQFEKLEEASKSIHTLRVIKEALEHQGFALDEDEAFKGLQDEITQLRESLEAKDKLIVEKEQAILVSKKAELLEKATSDLSELAKEKVKVLAEMVEADSVEQYEKLINVIVARQGTLTEEKQPKQVEQTQENLDEKNPLNTNVINESKKTFITANPSITGASFGTSTGGADLANILI